MEPSKKSKNQILREGFACFVSLPIPDELFNGYLNDSTGERTFIRLVYWDRDY